MKKAYRAILVMILALSLFLLGGCGKEAEEAGNDKKAEEAAQVQETPSATGKALDEAFAAGKAVFAQAEMPLPDLKTCEIHLPPDSYWEAYGQTRPTAEEFRSKTADSELTVFSYSPDGSTGIGWIDNAPVAFTENSVTLLYPAAERGAEDSYGALQTVFKQFSPKEYVFGTDGEGINWSPKGHYFCVMNYNRVIKHNQAQYGSPVITDTRTGEMFCVDAFDPKAMDNQDYGMWATGCFSADEQSFCAAYYGRRYYRSMLLRYDLNDCTCTMLENPLDTSYDYYVYPGMSVLSDGTVTALVAEKANVRKADILRIDQNLTSGRIPVIAMLDDASDKLFSNPKRMIASGASGEALIHVETRPGGLFYDSLMHIRAEDPEKGTDTVWVVRDNPLRLEAWTQAEIRDMAEAEKETLQELYLEYPRIIDVVLSPDGRYAAVLTGSPYTNQAGLLIVRLEDMATVPGEAALLEQLTYRDVSRYMNGEKYLLNWSEAGLLVVPACMMFRIQGS